MLIAEIQVEQGGYLNCHAFFFVNLMPLDGKKAESAAVMEL